MGFVTVDVKGTRMKIGMSRKKRTGSSSPVKGASPVPATGEDGVQARIAVRAYEIYMERGFREGHELDDWLEAERDVLGGQM